MTTVDQNTTHSAEAAALGFWYQALYALLTLVEQTTDDAAIGIEKLDDIELQADGKQLLYQLKHSISTAPPPITIKSKSLWKTIKVWVDALPKLTLAETTLHLVTVGGIAKSDPLQILTSAGEDRVDLAKAMTLEAERVLFERSQAAEQGNKLPHSERISGCQAFLELTEIDRLNMLRRTRIRPESPTVPQIEQEVAANLHILPAHQRDTVACRLVEWWDRQMVYSLCGQREGIISRTELQSQVSTIVADIEQDKLVPELETVSHPTDYQPDGMLFRQIDLVKGTRGDLAKAIREEWRAREQRARWTVSNPALVSKINDYDLLLKEYWSDLHLEMVDNSADQAEEEKQASGLNLLRWTHNDAPTTIRPISEGWNAAYYIRGSYQVLAINLQVGWHPDYEELLEDSE
ncbi:ABC-three component system protein [Neptunomonas marina]|uniref:ABC-three component systems C-terminal domain-containing protein n=1 Tax=Neptunomonas marina TaxID=1815562 RepID=A0A437Q4V3_9GAMM|nr:ABC-three component system protein [Neptunomonas marina]RVU29546.1 hypothetical protein EOE65_15350 [Neptunomonas marina]